MLKWLKKIWRSIFERESRPSSPDDRVSQTHELRWAKRPVAIYLGVGCPPPMHWKSCHPRTRVRFKAQMTCSRGHAIVLSGHSISLDGVVRPSVVCRTTGCDFHEWVELKDWTDGALP